MPSERWIGALVFVGVFAIGARWPDQPIVDGYVGRQVPTAMVARNLERGSGFLRPRLDTGPFPNLFLVEPPIDAAGIASIRSRTGWPIGRCGRLLSAASIALAAWGLFGLARRRGSPGFAIVAVAVFALLPVTLKYGRSCQPDPLMMGLVVAGLRVWDDHEAEGGRWRLALAWSLLALGLAVKVVAAFVLVPLLAAIVRSKRPGKLAIVLATLIPALLWYGFAAIELRSGKGSRASADNAGLWASAVSPMAWLRPGTLATVAKIAFWRAFTPLGLILAVGNLFGRSRGDRLWRWWLISGAGAFLLMPGKIHHEYYWLMLAPPIAAGVASGWAIGRAAPLSHARTRFAWSRAVFVGSAIADLFHFLRREEVRNSGPYQNLDSTTPNTNPASVARVPGASPRSLTKALPLVALVALALVQSRDSLRGQTPPQWSAGPRAAAFLDRLTGPDDLVVAPEALLFLADRRGCRLEVGERSEARAAGEWGGTIDAADPLALVEYYRDRGARTFADLWPMGDDPRRRLLHEAIRGRYNVKIDREGVILADLDEPTAARRATSWRNAPRR